MKDQLKITTSANREQVVATIGAEGFLSAIPGGFLWWFESIEKRSAAIDSLASMATCEPIDTVMESVVEVDKAVIEIEEIESGEHDAESSGTGDSVSDGLEIG